MLSKDDHLVDLKDLKKFDEYRNMTNTYEKLLDAPIVYQDLSDSNFTPTSNSYYFNTGSTSDLSPNCIYYYNGNKYKLVGDPKLVIKGEVIDSIAPDITSFFIDPKTECGIYSAKGRFKGLPLGLVNSGNLYLRETFLVRFEYFGIAIDQSTEYQYNLTIICPPYIYTKIGRYASSSGSIEWNTDWTTYKMITEDKEQQIDTNTTNIAELTEDVTTLQSAVDDNTASITAIEMDYGATIALSIDPTTYIITLSLINKDGTVLSTQTVDLPLESVVVNGRYDATNKKVVLTLQNGSTVEFSVADLVSGLQSEITSENPLSADLLVDGTNKKVFTATEQNKLAGIESGAQVNTVDSVNGKTGTVVVDYDDLTGKPLKIIMGGTGIYGSAEQLLPKVLSEGSGVYICKGAFSDIPFGGSKYLVFFAEVEYADGTPSATRKITITWGSTTYVNTYSGVFPSWSGWTTSTTISASEKSQIATNKNDIAALQVDKVDKNTPITGATKTKITFDANGLVTAGADLSASDIPTIEKSQVNGLLTDLQNLADDILNINNKIPAQASAQNQLADKDFVNSTVATNTANFIGTFNSLADLQAYSGTLTNNDYAFVIGTDGVGNTVYNRYKYNGTQWLFEYALNNSSFTAIQWAAINSGATASKIAEIDNKVNKVATPNKIYIVDANGNQSSVDFGRLANQMTYIPVVAAGGDMEVGQYVDFHDSASILDYDTRIQSDPDAAGNIILLPKTSGTLSLKTDIPTYYKHHIVVGREQNTGAAIETIYFEIDFIDTNSTVIPDASSFPLQPIFGGLWNAFAGNSTNVNGYYKSLSGSTVNALFSLMRIASIDDTVGTEGKYLDVSGFSMTNGAVASIHLYGDGSLQILVYDKQI